MLVVVRGDIIPNLTSFNRHLRAENLSSKTKETYCEPVNQLAAYLEDQGMPLDVAHIRREHIDFFIANFLETRKPSTASNRFRGCQSFFKWLVEEGEVKENPMARMKPPRVPEAPPDVLREDHLKALLAICEKGRDFESCRDAALIRIFVDTAARLSEVTDLRLDLKDDTANDVDLDQGILRVLGKGSRERVLAVKRKTVRSLDRYIRMRAQRHDAHSTNLWLGIKGPLTPSGVRRVLRRRGRQGGLGR